MDHENFRKEILDQIMRAYGLSDREVLDNKLKELVEVVASHEAAAAANSAEEAYHRGYADGFADK